MKKIIALILVTTLIVGMALASATTVMAGSGASIAITHDEATYTPGSGSTPRVYLAYKIFDAVYESLSGSNTSGSKDAFTYSPADAPVAYTMATDSPWKDAMTATAAAAWFDVKLSADGSVYVITPKTTYDSSAALAFAQYLQNNMPSPAPESTEVTVDGAAASVDPGYYLIIAKDTKDGVTKLALVTTDVTMVEKNTYIKVGKTTPRTSYSVGDPVQYTVTVDVPDDTALTKTSGTGYEAGHGPIILHDKLDSRLTFKGEMDSAKLGDADFTGYTIIWTENTSADNHTTNQPDECTFEIVIPVTEDILGKRIEFKYTANVNSTAATDTGLVNELGGENNEYKTVPDRPEVYTFDFDFLKTFSETDDPLTATFELRTDADNSGTAISFITNPSGSYIKADSDDGSGTTTITMTNGNQLNFLGFKAGTYYLVETSTSTGYNLLDGPVTVTITDTSTSGSISHSVTYTTINGTGSGTVTVVNNAGHVLPSTGGIGTTIFYVIGGLLAVGAGVVLVTKKRMGKEEN